MYSKVNYTIVGIFVLLFGIGLFWFAFWLAKYGLQEDYSTYKIEMKESIAGLSEDASVKLHGVNVGHVSQIRINPKDVQVIDIYVKIRQEIPIKEDMFASTKMLGVTGLLSIEIDGGSNTSKTLHPTKEYIPMIKSKPSLISKVTANLGGMSVKLDHLLSQSQKLFSDHNIETFGNILTHVENVSKKGEVVEEKAIVALDEANNTLQAFRTSMHNVDKEFKAAVTDFKQMQRDFASIKKVSVPTINKLMQTSKDFRRVTLKVEKSLDRGDYNLKKILSPVLIDVQILSKQLGDMSRQLEQNPSGLLFKSRKSRRGPGE
ncbi:MAG TPA: MCE family protein [Epsilonproteobacteria bacterium]|nr:MCE family protein [Campylobacterota bacterium]